MHSQSTSVAIVGAGLVGTSIAWRLSQANVPVTLIDAGPLGGEASSAGAGMLAPGGEFDQPSPWLDLGIEGMRLYPAFVEELRSETHLPVDFQLCGCTHFAPNGQARRRAEFQSRAGIRVELIPEGLFYPEDGFVDPVDLLRALRRTCEQRGVEIVERSPVREIESSDYAAIVIAAGAWSSDIRVTHKNQPAKLPGAFPVKGHLIGFQMDPGTLGPMRRQGHTYVLQRSNGFTVAGSNEERAGFDRTVNSLVCQEIHEDVSRLFPALARITPSAQWVGFRPRAVQDSGPHIERVEGTNVWLAYGHYRNGILLAPLTAQRLASEIISAV